MFFKKSLQTSTLFLLSVFSEEYVFQGSSLNVKSNNNSTRGKLIIARYVPANGIGGEGGGPIIGTPRGGGGGGGM
jgi:hypothetical protein